MDESRNLCLINTNLKKQKYEKHIYKATNMGSPRAVRNNSISHIPSVDLKLKVKDNYINNINLSDPYKNLDTIFPERSSMVLANIDAVFNLTGQVSGYLLPQNTKEYDYGVLGDSKAGYVEYMQYRLPVSTGFVYCSKSLNNERINKDNLDILNPTDLAFNDIRESDQKYVKYVTSIIPDGLDLLISNNTMKNSLSNGLKTLKTGGKLVIRFDDSNLADKKLLDLIYITSMNFEKINLFKPISEDLNGFWSYLIAENYHNQPSQWLDLIHNETNIKLPRNFTNYIEEYNNSLNNLKEQLSKTKEDNIYNMYKCLSMWNMI